MQKKIVIKGAKEHNLKNVSVEIPKDKFVVITGISGSGKSSLAFDTIYAEGQRKYVESLFPNILDINIVNFYVLPPGGYLFPHVDPCTGPKNLNKLYIPLLWETGNEFGFYKWGNMPLKQGNVYLINNYRFAHWVLNRSNTHRIVLDIGANLNSLSDRIINSFLCKFV